MQVTLFNKERDEVIFSKQFTDEIKANALKSCLEKYLDSSKAEVRIESKEKRRKYVKNS